MDTEKLIKKFENTTLSNDKTKHFLGSILKKEFHQIKDDAKKSEDILFLAWKFQVPQFDEMFEDHQNHDNSIF